mmetsp:Transcript_22784/g.49919  ORF Transcript_22784/g.49919 Transcript_22784/m.49919 type:complete len:158 (+) Transcript_22784:282-755(+)
MYLPFTPIILVSPSQPCSYERKCSLLHQRRSGTRGQKGREEGVPDASAAARNQQQQQQPGCTPPGPSSPLAAADAAMEWDCGLHLPLWVPRNERLQIEARLEGWVDSVGADVERLAQVLQKPLRPLWISQDSRIWVDQAGILGQGLRARVCESQGRR